MLQKVQVPFQIQIVRYIPYKSKMELCHCKYLHQSQTIGSVFCPICTVGPIKGMSISFDKIWTLNMDDQMTTLCCKHESDMMDTYLYLNFWPKRETKHKIR